jgi:hypothetical protein
MYWPWLPGSEGQSVEPAMSKLYDFVPRLFVRGERSLGLSIAARNIYKA